MAITPTEARKKAQPNATERKRLEAMIDESIVERMKLGMEATFATDLFPDSTTQDAIITTYRSKGWDVQYHSDWRDGDYIIIKPRRTSQDSSGYYDYRENATSCYDR